MDSDEIIEALESTATTRKDRGRIGDPSCPDRADVVLWRDRLMRFLDELDGDLTVDEIKAALEDYS